MISNISKLPSEGAQSLSFVAGSCPSPTASDSSDASLINRIASGEKLAMSALYARHHVRVYRFALRFVRDEGLAEDLVSEVFLDVWRKARTFEGRSQVSTWLLAITRHKAIEVLRRRSTDPLDEDACEAIEDSSDDPETAIQKKQRGVILINSLKKLSPAHREIIDLVYYHEKTIDEVADIIGVPRNTVKTRMFYARQHLGELLSAEGLQAD